MGPASASVRGVRTIAAASCLLGVALAASARPTPVEVAREEAEANAKSPAGKRYEGVMVSRLEEWLRPALERA